MSSTTESPPSAYARHIPVNATVDAELMQELDELCIDVAGNLGRINRLLATAATTTAFDVAAERVAAELIPRLPSLSAASANVRREVVRFADYLPPQGRARVLRRYIKDPSPKVRRAAAAGVRNQYMPVYEVALPASGRYTSKYWDQRGWSEGAGHGRLFRHGKNAAKRLKSHKLPKLQTVGELRELLGIRSERQLGWLLTANDGEGRPYTRFTIPKARGGQRTICAPKDDLRFVQRKILDEILAKVPAHEAAHGFVPGRSITTNAEPHVGAELLVKFDLENFFPTIHYHRVLGLFASLGYHVELLRFATADDSKAIAPVLARLCTWARDSRDWGGSVCPQGAPTSPAISNLICRRLDARLEGLIQKWDPDGAYTRYADDLTFSFRTVPDNLGRFRWWVDQVCHQEGFLVHQGKFRVIRSSQQQRVTGVVVNEGVRVPRKDRRRFRAILHNCRKNGVESEARDRNDFEGYLRGFAAYVHMVQPEEGKRLMAEVAQLLGDAQ